jgi:molybdopterin molybdotransferase
MLSNSAAEPVPLDRRLPEEAWAWVAVQAGADSGIAAPRPLSRESVPVEQALGRVLANPVFAAGDVPPRPLAAGDGYAVVAASSEGAGAYNPLPLQLRGRDTTGAGLLPGDAQAVSWGEPLPPGADAVLSLEDTEPTAAGIEIDLPVARGEQVIGVGAECRIGDEVLAAGHRLRAQDLAMLRLLGLDQVDLIRPPRVRMVLTCAPGQDVDADMLRALIERDGGALESVQSTDGAHRRLAELLAADGLDDGSDVVLCVGGTGLGVNDRSSAVLAALGELDIRGVAIGPGDTLTLGRTGQRPVCLLPGPPLACFCAYELVVGRLIRRLAGWPDDARTAWPHAVVEAVLARKIASPLGTLQLCRVRLRDGLAEPLDLAGGRLLRSAVRADGFVVVPLQSEGYPRGERVLVRRF